MEKLASEYHDLQMYVHVIAPYTQSRFCISILIKASWPLGCLFLPPSLPNMPNFDESIAELSYLLDHLPSSLPAPRGADSQYRFVNYAPSPDTMKRAGDITQAVLYDLDARFNAPEDRLPNDRRGPLFRITERGAELNAVTQVLRKYHQLCDDKRLFTRWAALISHSIRHTCEQAGQVRSCLALPS